MTTPLAEPPAIRVLGVRVHMVQMPQVLSILEQWIGQRKKCHFVVATGMHGVMEAHRDEDFKAIINSADLFIPDGYSLIWVGRRRGFRLKRRVCGTDLMWEFLAVSQEKGYSNFFYGDTRETLDQLTLRIEREFPGLKIAGTHSPPFRPLSPEEQAQDIKTINESNADVVWVGLGLPRQERWIFQHKDALNAPAVIGVGAAFKFHSGQVTRAPEWAGNRGFEWLWRLAREPKRVWRRALIDAPRFASHVVLELAGIRKYD